MHGKQIHSSNYMNLLECLNDRPCVPSPHRLPHTCLSQYASKIISFQNKSLLFSKTHYRISVKVLDYPPRRMCWRTFLNNSWAPPTCNCWTISQHHSPENHPLKFLSKTFSFFFQFSCHALTPNTLGCPSAYGMHDVNSNTFMLIYSHAYILT